MGGRIVLAQLMRSAQSETAADPPPEEKIIFGAAGGVSHRASLRCWRCSHLSLVFKWPSTRNTFFPRRRRTIITWSTSKFQSPRQCYLYTTGVFGQKSAAEVVKLLFCSAGSNSAREEKESNKFYGLYMNLLKRRWPRDDKVNKFPFFYFSLSLFSFPRFVVVVVSIPSS